MATARGTSLYMHVAKFPPVAAVPPPDGPRESMYILSASTDGFRLNSRSSSTPTVLQHTGPQLHPCSTPVCEWTTSAESWQRDWRRISSPTGHHSPGPGAFGIFLTEFNALIPSKDKTAHPVKWLDIPCWATSSTPPLTLTLKWPKSSKKSCRL